MKFFVDTSAFVALENRRDAAHATSVRVYRRILRQSAVLVTSDYVFDETVTLLKRRAGSSVAVSWGRRLLSSAVLEVAFVDRAVLDAALQIFEGAGDQPFSFTDCTSFALMRSWGIDSAFTLDDDFAHFGFDVVPRR